MKTISLKALVAACVALVPLSAQAANANVENALKGNPELSSFYYAMAQSGVLNELDPNKAYTVFAPTNTAFAKVHSGQYPCIDVSECKEEVADIMRNHIVPGIEYIGSGGKGGFFSIDDSFIPVGQPNRNHYAVDGQSIRSFSSFPNVRLYIIDGMITGHPVPNMPLSEQVRRVTKSSTHTIADPACGPGGCPEASTETTTIIRTITGGSDTGFRRR